MHIHTHLLFLPSTGTGELSPDAPLTIVTDDHLSISLPGPHLPLKTTPTRSADGGSRQPGTVEPPPVPSAKSKKSSKKATVERKKEPHKTTSRKKKDVDPHAPKKPSNAFFWFCQEHRPGLREQYRGEGVSGQHDLTKVLAKRWSETSTEDKKVRTLMYG